MDKLEQTNLAHSKVVFFLRNRLAFLLLEHLALAASEEVRQDPALNFEFAHNRIKNTDLAAVFYERLMKAENRETFIETFGEMLRHETQRHFEGSGQNLSPARSDH